MFSFRIYFVSYTRGTRGSSKSKRKQKRTEINFKLCSLFRASFLPFRRMHIHAILASKASKGRENTARKINSFVVVQKRDAVFLVEAGAQSKRRRPPAGTISTTFISRQADAIDAFALK